MHCSSKSGKSRPILSLKRSNHSIAKSLHRLVIWHSCFWMFRRLFQPESLKFFNSVGSLLTLQTAASFEKSRFVILLKKLPRVSMVSGMNHHTNCNRVCKNRCSLTLPDLRQLKLQVSVSSKSKQASNCFRNGFRLTMRCKSFGFFSGVEFSYCCSEVAN